MWYFWFKRTFKPDTLEVIVQPSWVTGTTDIILKLLEEGRWLK